MNSAFKFWQVYKDEHLMVKLHIFGRATICPFSKLIPYFPTSGNILDVGCGYGLLLYFLNEDVSNKGRRLIGIDHDLKKVNIAKRYANTNIKFYLCMLEELEPEKFEAVSIIDVLYCIDLNKWKVVLDKCFCILRPGGRLIVKETIDKPRWRSWLTIIEEKFAIGVCRITQGDKPHIESKETYSSALRKSGFIIDVVKPFNTWHWSSQCLFIATKRE